MATKKPSASTAFYRFKPKKRRKGVHSKNNTSKHKHSKNYVKLSRGQN